MFDAKDVHKMFEILEMQHFLPPGIETSWTQAKDFDDDRRVCVRETEKVRPPLCLLVWSLSEAPNTKPAKTLIDHKH